MLFKCVDSMRSYVSEMATGQPCEDTLSDACRQIIDLNSNSATVPDALSDESSAELAAGKVGKSTTETEGLGFKCTQPNPERVDAAAQATNEQPVATVAAQLPRAEVKSKPTETLRVNIERLDKLMSLAGQLAINKARFRQIGESLKRMSTFKAMAQSIAGAQHAASRLTAGMDELSAISAVASTGYFVRRRSQLAGRSRCRCSANFAAQQGSHPDQ